MSKNLNMLKHPSKQNSRLPQQQSQLPLQQDPTFLYHPHEMHNTKSIRMMVDPKMIGSVIAMAVVSVSLLVSPGLKTLLLGSGSKGPVIIHLK